MMLTPTRTPEVRSFLTACILGLLLALAALPAMGANRNVNIDFNDVEISVFIKYISEVTGKNFVIDNRIRGKVTIVSPGAVTVYEAWDIFESVLEVHGFAAIPSGEVYKVVTQPDARTKAMQTSFGEGGLGESDRMITQIIPLQYADPEELRRLFAPLVSKTSVLLSYASSRMLIVTDSESNIRRILEIVRYIDVRDKGREIRMISLTHADAAELVGTLEAVFRQTRREEGSSVTEDAVKFVADKRTNTLIILASKVDVERVEPLVRQLDSALPKGRGRVHVYYLENAVAEDLASVLQAMVGRNTAGGGTGTNQPVVSADVTVTADSATNSLVIMANQGDHAVLGDVIQKLDIPRSMVLIEALIVEVSVSSTFGLGAEWAVGDTFSKGGADAAFGGGFSGTAGNSAWSNSIGLAKGGMLPSGFSIGVAAAPLVLKSGGQEITFPNLGALIQAYESDRNSHILATPQITTLDNREASITVGRNIPYLIKSATGDNAYNNYEYKDVGVQLKITPQISKEGLIRLDIFQEVTRLLSTAGTLNELPTTLKRSIDTTVLVRDRNTVVIGGLIDDSFSESEYKVPCLGDIPGLRLLFSSMGREREKTNLFVFITPHIIRTVEDGNRVTQDRLESISELSPTTIPLYEENRKAKELPRPMVMPSDSPGGEAAAEEKNESGEVSADTPESERVPLSERPASDPSVSAPDGESDFDA
ncbi:type II secretion system secretin GspD [Desulfobotulus sp. H1]|uniref:Type II secretion system secretin GspD n=1 Tax=Desulfobotulus pelophilus TaxID=2823377 RepID=A0ABT3N677_9BACT|nr:type II secretion system secretin GspD [Desulfobotulus pelophilus]MCW7752961.1 type II secretion system secretin GspD [Desulfobotulus pelophilus]